MFFAVAKSLKKSTLLSKNKEKSTITITLQKSEDKIHLIFEDQGIGIKDPSKIFDRYYRGDKITGGFGIGLSIVKNICVKNNIKISVESQVNQGSTFSYLISSTSLEVS